VFGRVLEFIPLAYFSGPVTSTRRRFCLQIAPKRKSREILEQAPGRRRHRPSEACFDLRCTEFSRMNLVARASGNESENLLRACRLLSHSQGPFYQIGCDREFVSLSNRLLHFARIIPIGEVV
jgi:hypothetical protein